MARKPRCASSTGIYHVMLRGVNKQTIFEEAEDYTRFLQCLTDAKEQSGFKLFAYCLMSNHVHLLIKEESETISQAAHRFASKYAIYFNYKYDRCGPLFQGRFKSEAIEDDPYLITVLIYIYQNPVKAGLCGHSQDYRWSSRRFLGKGSSLVDEKTLFEFVSLNAITTKETSEPSTSHIETGLDSMSNISDAAVIARLIAASKAKGVSSFQKLDPSSQAAVLVELHQQGAAVRQLARLSGLGKSLVERRCLTGRVPPSIQAAHREIMKPGLHIL